MLEWQTVMLQQHHVKCLHLKQVMADLIGFVRQ